MNQELTKTRKPIDPQIAELYAKLERHLMPTIRSGASRLARKLREDPEDLIQDARLNLALALSSYDYNRSHGGIFAYAREAVRTAMFNAAQKAASRGRTRVGEDGHREWVPVFSWSTQVMDDTLFSDATGPEDSVVEMEEHEQFKTRFYKLRMRMMRGLTQHHQAVFCCLYHPDAAFQAYLRNKGVVEPSNVHVSEYLGLSKNVIDWSIHKIKRDFTRLAELDLPDFVKLAASERRWPMIYQSDRAEDAELVSSTILNRDLDARPTARVETENEGARRVVETYPWGAVIFLSLGEQQATLLVEGRFNARSGEVIADGGHWKSVADYVNWYPELERRLRRVAKVA